MLHVDNQFTIAIAKNLIHHSCTKHIRVKYYSLRDVVKDKEIDLKYCPTDFQIADVFIKALSKERFEFLRSCPGIHQINDYGDVLK